MLLRKLFAGVLRKASLTKSKAWRASLPMTFCFQEIGRQSFSGIGRAQITSTSSSPMRSLPFSKTMQSRTDLAGFLHFWILRSQKEAMPKEDLPLVGLHPPSRNQQRCSWPMDFYPSLGYAPTKLNIADDPTRDAPLRATDHLSLTPALKKGDAKRIHVRTLPKVLAAWTRIVILLLQSCVSEGCLVHHNFYPQISFLQPWILIVTCLFLALLVSPGFFHRICSSTALHRQSWISAWTCSCPFVRCLQCLILLGFSPCCQAYNFGVIKTEYMDCSHCPSLLL